MELVKYEEEEPVYKSKRLWVGLALTVLFIIAISVAYHTGKSATTIKLAKEKVTYEELNAKVKKAENKQDTLKIDNENATRALSNMQNVINTTGDEFDSGLAKMNALQIELNDLQSQINGRKAEVTKLDKAIEDKNKELASITKAP